MHISIKIIILKVFTKEGNLRSAFRFALPVGIPFTRWKKNRAWSYIVDFRERDENPIWYWILFCLTFQQWTFASLFLGSFFPWEGCLFPTLIPIDSYWLIPFFFSVVGKLIHRVVPTPFPQNFVYFWSIHWEREDTCEWVWTSFLTSLC